MDEFFHVVREYHSDGEQRHEMFSQSLVDAVHFIETQTVDLKGRTNVPSVADFVVYRCTFGMTTRAEVHRAKGRS